VCVCTVECRPITNCLFFGGSAGFRGPPGGSMAVQAKLLCVRKLLSSVQCKTNELQILLCSKSYSLLYPFYLCFSVVSPHELSLLNHPPPNAFHAVCIIFLRCMYCYASPALCISRCKHIRPTPVWGAAHSFNSSTATVLSLSDNLACHLTL